MLILAINFSMDSNTLLLCASVLTVYLLFGLGLLYVKNKLNAERKVFRTLFIVLSLAFLMGLILMGVALFLG
jgi:cytochrome c biogenesis protein CcdA